METRRKGRHGQSEESEAVSPSSPDRESEQESPESGEKGEGMSITELVRWLATREDEARREAEERERRRDEKIVQALNAMEEKQAAFAAELRTRATAQPEPEGHPPVKAGSRETTSEQEAAEVPSTLWQVLRHLEEGRKEERRLLVETLGGGTGSFKYRELKGGDDIEHYLLAFERAATTARIKKEAWVVKLAPFLTSKALAAYANMAPEEACNYDCLKDTILKRYNISEETYRQRFRSCRKKGEESYQEHASRLRDLFSKWIQPKEKTV